MTNLVLDEGDFAEAGKAVLAVLDSDSFRVEAYLEETKLNFVKVGDSATVILMSGAPAIEGKMRMLEKWPQQMHRQVERVEHCSGLAVARWAEDGANAFYCEHREKNFRLDVSRSADRVGHFSGMDRRSIFSFQRLAGSSWDADTVGLPCSVRLLGFLRVRFIRSPDAEKPPTLSRSLAEGIQRIQVRTGSAGSGRLSAILPSDRPFVVYHRRNVTIICETVH